MLSLLCGMNKVKKGQVFINGKSISKIKYKEIAKSISMVHQQNEVPGELSVYDLVSFGRVPYKKAFENYSEADESLIQWAMEVTGVSKYKETRVMDLSGGERQRAFIAMALAQDTEILFLDEPTTYLDIFHQIRILDIIKRLNEEKGITVVMVLHDINQALQYSDNIIVMKKGEKIICGESKEVLDGRVIEQVYGVKGVITGIVEGSNYFIPLRNVKI